MSRICEEADGNTCLYSKGIDSLPGGGGGFHSHDSLREVFWSSVCPWCLIEKSSGRKTCGVDVRWCWVAQTASGRNSHLPSCRTPVASPCKEPQGFTTVRSWAGTESGPTAKPVPPLFFGSGAGECLAGQNSGTQKLRTGTLPSTNGSIPAPTAMFVTSTSTQSANML